MSSLNPTDQALRAELKKLLDGGQAHATFDDAVKGFPPELQGTVPERLPYSAWQLVEHLRIAQRDILDFCQNGNGTYKPLKWPDDYWPKVAAPQPGEWAHCLDQIRNDRLAFEALLQKSSREELVKPFPWGEGQTLMREALLIADHAAYHTGELIVLRRLLGCWKS